MKRVIVLTCTSLAALSCGGGSERAEADATVRLASRALLYVETSGGETPEIAEALRDAHDWLAPTEAAIEMWSEGGDAAYERVAPCLGATLTELRLRMLAESREVPASLEQAEEQAHGASEQHCVR